jgi:imidazole glycerol-phosphate synthase subunit HisF
MQRLIFTVLYDRGTYMLSRNFRLQRVGTLDWLFTNYDLANVSHGLDELMVIDVSRERRPDEFARHVTRIAERCFIPVTVGGGITSPATAQLFLRSGADKLLVNTAFLRDPGLCEELAGRYGRQCVVGGVDYRGGPRATGAGSPRQVVVENGATPVPAPLADWVDQMRARGAGEVLLQSVDRDGTGMGLDLGVVRELDDRVDLPVILMGGVGKAANIIEGLKTPGVDAVATANLYNFIGAAFLETRDAMREAGLSLAYWADRDYASLKDRFACAS